MPDRIPYTYLIKFIHPKKNKVYWYYGVRYGKGCKPEDLFVTYFSSSAHLQSYIKRYGIECFQWEIRKIFTNKIKAQLWEHKVLRRLNARNRKDSFNKSNGYSNIVDQTGIKRSDETKEKIRQSKLGNIPWNKGKKMPIAMVEKSRNSNKGRIPWNKGVPMQEKQKEKLRQANLGKKHSIETKEKMSKIKKGKQPIHLQGLIPWNKGLKIIKIETR